MGLSGIIRALDMLLLAGTAAKRIKGRMSAGEGLVGTVSNEASRGWLESRLTGVVVSALKEAFSRDHARLEFEREAMEASRRRAEEALRLELRRQVIDRELGRLRLLSAVALLGWIASVALLVARLDQASAGLKTGFTVGWVLLLAALASSFSAQRQVGGDFQAHDDLLENGISATVSLWLLVAGLAVSGLSLLL